MEILVKNLRGPQKVYGLPSKNKTKLDDGHIYKLSSSWIKPTISESSCFKSAGLKVAENTCSMTETDIRLAQSRLTSWPLQFCIDGKIGTGTNWAFTNLENLLGEFADDKKACLSKEEIKWIEVLDWATK